MLNVTSLYTNIGSQFIPFVALPTKSKHTQLGSIPIFLPRKKNTLKMCTIWRQGRNEQNNSVNTAPTIQNKANTND